MNGANGAGTNVHSKAHKTDSGINVLLHEGPNLGWGGGGGGVEVAREVTDQLQNTCKVLQSHILRDYSLTYLLASFL